MEKSFVEEYIIGMFVPDGEGTTRKVISLCLTYFTLVLAMDQIGIEFVPCFAVPFFYMMGLVMMHGATAGTGEEHE